MICEIREICGDWALSISFLYETVTIYFNSLQNAKNVKHIIETDRSVPNCATLCDMVEVVRCKDCRYWQDNNGGYPHPDCKWGNDETPDADDYCSCGERMKENDERKSH